jgi:hypothetical protein
MTVTRQGFAQGSGPSYLCGIEAVIGGRSAASAAGDSHGLTGLFSGTPEVVSIAAVTGLFAGAAVWMFRRWGTRSGRPEPEPVEAAPSEPAARPQPRAPGLAPGVANA